MSSHALKKRKLNHPSKTHDLTSDSDPSFKDSPADLSNGTPSTGFRQHVSIPPRSRATQSTASNSGDMYNSNMFKLQLDELLDEVKLKYKTRMIKAEYALRKIKDIVENIPSRDAKSLVHAERELMRESKTAIPFPEPRPASDVKYSFSYQKPVNINVVGSYALKTAMKSKEPFVIDLAVTMPSRIFQEKDYLNHRYFHKKAYYLACIAAGVRRAEQSTLDLSYSYQNDNQLQPVLLLIPSSDGGDDDFSSSKCHIRILLAAERDLFPVAKTMPERNCVRVQCDSSDLISQDLPTPRYNATLRAECCVTSYLKLLYEASKQSEGFKNACILTKIWLRQRGIGTRIFSGGFGNFEAAAMMAILMQGSGPKGRPVFSTGYSSYQLFKALLQYLATRDLVREPFVTGSDVSHPSKSGTPMFFDVSKGLNLLFKMTPWSYKLLRHEARLSLEVLGRSTSDHVGSSFISRVDNPIQRFDILIRVSIPSSWRSRSDLPNATERCLDFCELLHRILVTGLGDRVKIISLQTSGHHAWRTMSSTPSKVTDGSVLIGLVVDPQNIGRAVDHGPAAEDKKAASAYRNFWGEKAELRRFKDGSIVESLIWFEKDVEKDVLQQILSYVVLRHISDDAANGLKFLAYDFDQLILPRNSSTTSSMNIFQPLCGAYELFEKHMRGLEALPLHIRHISAADPDLRYASVKPQVIDSCQRIRRPMEVLVQFEGSTRWPDDLSAIQRTKVAFLLKIGELLEESVPGLTSRLGLENEKQVILNSAFLDIIYSTAAAFRLRIYHDRELTLLDRQLKDGSLNPTTREQTAHAISTHKRTFISTPLHTQTVRALCTRFPLLSPTIRLTKKWCNSHMLSSHLSQELIELLTIRTFVHPYPWSTPGSVRTGFLRTLIFISKWDWRSEPLIVDMKGEMTVADYDAINLRLEAWRKIDPAMNRMVIFAASNIDPDGITWTEQGPSKVIAARFTSLARAACNVVEQQGLEIKASALFATSLTDYDLVIHLNPKVFGGDGSKEKQQTLFKNLHVQASADPALVGYDPLQSFIEELGRIYGNNIIFFHNEDEVAEPVVPGLWSPETGPRAWKVNLTYSTMPVQGKSGEAAEQVSINKSAIVNDIARLGGDMILKVDSRS